jgi:hypothetical protein
MNSSAVLYALGYTAAVLLGCFVFYTLVVRYWREADDTQRDRRDAYKLPCIALSISRKQSCCRPEEFQRLVRETINNDAIVKSVSPLGKSMFIIEIDIRDFNEFESEYGSVVNIVRHFMNLRTPNPPLPKASGASAERWPVEVPLQKVQNIKESQFNGNR